MADDINIEVFERTDHLAIECDEKEFAQLCDKVLSAIQYRPKKEFFQIGITNIDALHERAESARRFDGYALIGCGVVAFILLSIFIVGVTEIISWFR